MKTEKTDRRVKYTKMLLKKSLVDLMREAPISRISVKSLCEAADINRSTFYAHYTDPYDLLRKLEQEVIAEFERRLANRDFSQHSDKTVQGLNEIFIYVSENVDLFKVLLSENGDPNFQREVMILAQQKTISELRNDQSINARTSEYMQSFVVAGALSMVQKWLQDGLVESTEEMAVIASNLLYNGISAF